MPDPQHDQEPDGEDYTVTLTGHMSDQAWEALTAEMDELRRQED